MGPGTKPRFRIVRWLGLAGAIGAIAATSAWAAGLKSPKYYKATGTHLYPVAIADINGDGRQDIVVGSEAHKTVSILYGKKGGGFTGPHDYKAGPYPFWISVADFNHDHRLDIAVASDDKRGKVVVLLAKTHGGFKSSTYAVGKHPYAMAVGDFNRDGNKDLVVVNSSSNDFSILLGRHDGTFRKAITKSAGSHPVAVVAHDFNGDGKEDLAILDTANPGSSVRVLDGRGNGTFKKHGDFNVGAAFPRGMAAGRFSGAKRWDLAVPDCNQAVNDVYVLDGKKSGGFGNPQPFPNYQASCSYESAVGDVNGDGHPDLITATDQPYVGGSVSILYGEGNGKLSSYSLFNATSPHQNYSIAIGKLNGDKRLDLVVPDYDQARVAVLYGKP